MAQEEICCPQFNPEPWDNKTIEWTNKRFIKEKVFTFMYMPINYGKAMEKVQKKVNYQAGTEVIVLSDHTSMWNMDIYFEVPENTQVEGSTEISGKFFTKVYEGDFKDTGKWMQDYDKTAKEKGLNIEKFYMWYTTCPKCAKKYGKNYTVVLGKMMNDR